MCRLKEQRKIILILSDGMPDSFTATRYALQQAQALGFEVMGLGILDTSLTHIMSSASRTCGAYGESEQPDSKVKEMLALPEGKNSL